VIFDLFLKMIIPIDDVVRHSGICREVPGATLPNDVNIRQLLSDVLCWIRYGLQARSSTITFSAAFENSTPHSSIYPPRLSSYLVLSYQVTTDALALMRQAKKKASKDSDRSHSSAVHCPPRLLF
jgi:hypothetical protein